MSEIYSDASFERYKDKCDSAIDEQLFDRIVGLLSCQSDPDGEGRDLDIDSREKMFEHFNSGLFWNIFFWVFVLALLCLAGYALSRVKS